MRLGSACLLLMFASLTMAQETPAWKPLQISWHGQSFFILTTSKGTRVAFDPHLIPEYGRPEGLKADIICISHNHTDHNRPEALENARDKNVRILQGLRTGGLRAEWNPIDEKIDDVQVRTVGLYHDNSEGLERGKVSAFVLEVDGWRVVHLGDLGHSLTPAQLKKLGPVDVVMIPVGGIYTLNGSEAKKVIDQLKPREYIFPMHCGTKIYEDLLPATEFVDEFPRAQVAVSDDNAVRLNRDAARPRPLLVQLHYAPKKK